MLTVAQPASLGPKSVHDLPTPPFTSRPSPPPAYYEKPDRPLIHPARCHSPATQSMSAPHRGLPPPAALGLSTQQPTPSVPPPPHAVHHSHPAPPAIIGHGQLPPPPQQWHGGEESMKTWLVARAEEEKTKQEGERTRQEELRLEQRKLEIEILRSSLNGGIPPPMIPMVFAGMGNGSGTVSQSAMEWAQQYLQGGHGHHPQLLAGSSSRQSPEHSRDPTNTSGGQYSHSASMAGMAPSAQPGHYGIPASPTRSRGQTISGPLSRAPQPFPGATGQSALGQASYQSQPQGAQQEGAIFFHHWQPPATQGSVNSNPPGTPSGDMSRKRKAQQPGPQHSEGRLRSPPAFTPKSAGSAASFEGGHKRQRSDHPWPQQAAREQLEERERPYRTVSPPSAEPMSGLSRREVKAESSIHSVSSLLSAEPDAGVDSCRQADQYSTTQATGGHAPAEQKSMHSHTGYSDVHAGRPMTPPAVSRAANPQAEQE